MTAARSPKVVPLHGGQDDAALVAAVRADRPGARDELYARHGAYVRRVLLRVLGRDGDLDDALQEVFMRALGSIDSLERPDRVRSWLSSIAVLTAKDVLRRRQRRSWLRYFRSEEVPDVLAVSVSVEAREALRAVYVVLDAMPVDERIVFALRFIEKMTLQEVAEACGVSLATAKRGLQRARASFAERARAHDALRDRLDGGGWR